MNVYNMPGGSKIELVRRTACSSLGVNFSKFDALRSHLRPFLDPSSALSVAHGRLDSDSISTSTSVEYMVW